MNSRKLKGVAFGVLLALAAGGAPSVMASGIPVVDVANLTQQIQQVAHMVSQIQTLESQLKQAEQQYKALTGGRGFENLARGNDYGRIPTSWQETLAMMEGGSNISGLAQSIKDQSRQIDTRLLDHVNANVAGLHDTQLNTSASHLANAGTAYDSASDRMVRLQGLMDAIGTASDMKAISDLQARIQVESALLQNEQIRMQALAQAATAQQQLQTLQAAELGVRKPVGEVSMGSVVRDR